MLSPKPSAAYLSATSTFSADGSSRRGSGGGSDGDAGGGSGGGSGGGGGRGYSQCFSPALLSPQPITIDMPSPSFDPMLEHFLRPLEEMTACACVMERAARGKAFRVLVEEGNVLLLVAERRHRDFEISAADGTRIATLHRVRRRQFALRRATMSTSMDPELAAIVLGDKEVPNAPSRPKLNHLRVATVRPTPSLAELIDRVGALDVSDHAAAHAEGGSGGSGAHADANGVTSGVGGVGGGVGGGIGGGSVGGVGDSAAQGTACNGVSPAGMAGRPSATVFFPPEPSPLYTRMLGRPNGELLAALLNEGAKGGAADGSLMFLESRLPEWDDQNCLLTLDYPPGRANHASVQNFQLQPPAPPPPPPGATAEQIAAAARAAQLAHESATDDDAAFNATLVHGLMQQTDALDTFSLDMHHPLSPLLAFAICLASQDWE